MPEQEEGIPGPENSSWKAGRCESAEQVAAWEQVGVAAAWGAVGALSEGA